jgi:hypothetical protein
MTEILQIVQTVQFVQIVFARTNPLGRLPACRTQRYVSASANAFWRLELLELFERLGRFEPPNRSSSDDLAL